MFSLSIKPLIYLKQSTGCKLVLSSVSFHCPSCSQWKLTKIVNCNKTADFIVLRRACLSTSSFCFQNHYEVLGIERNATGKEIKAAYLQLSKELHPDKHQSADLNIDVTSSASNGSDAQKEVHDRFVAVNTAYGVLSKPSTKEIYDLGLSRESMFGGNSSENSRNHRYKYSEYPDFHERAKAAGYSVDPDYFKKHTSSYKIAGLCVIWIVAGFVFQFVIGLLVSDHHQTVMMQRSATISKGLKESVAHTQKIGTEQFLQDLKDESAARQIRRRKLLEKQYGIVSVSSGSEASTPSTSWASETITLASQSAVNVSDTTEDL